MLPEPYRLHHRADFSRTVRRGQRIGRRDLVVHVFTHQVGCAVGHAPASKQGYDGVVDMSEPHGDPAAVSIRVGGPRFGLIVSKAVGNAVIRHRVARRLRHMCHQMISELPSDTDVVIRALPGAADASSAELLRQMRAAMRKLGVGTV